MLLPKHILMEIVTDSLNISEDSNSGIKLMVLETIEPSQLIYQNYKLIRLKEYFIIRKNKCLEI